MNYVLSRDVANDYSHYCDNVIKPRSYFVPFSSSSGCDDGEYIRSRYFSDRVRVLNGTWDFVFYPDGIQDNKFTSDIFEDTIEVPASWESVGLLPSAFVKGYEFPLKKLSVPDGKNSLNSLGIYRKIITINDFSKKYFLNFQSVGGAFEVHVNGKYCGYSSLGTAEFDITPFILNGNNEIIVAVKRWSIASFANGGNHFPSTGITGDVYIVKTNGTHLFDYDFYCKSDGNVFEGRFAFTFETEGGGATADITLSHKGKQIKRVRKFITDEEVTMDFYDEFLPYTSETPELYDLYVRVVDNGRVTECTKLKVGFCSIDETEGVVTCCSRPLKIRGVDYNVTLSRSGEKMTLADYEEDFDLLSSYGFNTIKTERYLDPIVLLAAAEHGIYVIEDVSLNGAGFSELGEKKRDLLGTEAKFSDLVALKTEDLYSRRKALPSLIAFSFGEENGKTKNFIKAASFVSGKGQKLALIKNDDNVSVLFRPTVDGLIDELNRISASRPVFMAEYALCSGIGSASVDDFADLVDNTPCCVGGCISRFIDDYYDDTCIRDDGLFKRDRVPYAAAHNHRYAVRPVRVRICGENKIEVYNASYFKGTSDKILSLSVYNNGRRVGGSDLIIDLPPRTAREINYELGAHDGDKYLRIACVDKNSDTLISVEQQRISAAIVGIDVHRSGSLKVKEFAGYYEIRFDAGIIRFARDTGSIVGYNLLGKDVLSSARRRNECGCFMPNIDRPFVRNILSGKLDETDYSLVRSDVTIDSDRVKAKSVYEIKINNKLAYTVTDDYNIYGNGLVEVTSELKAEKKCPPDMDCFGKTIRFGKTFDDIVYYGKGEEDTYIDMNMFTFTGIYRTDAKTMSSFTPFGQERGNHTDVHYAVVTDRAGDGLMIAAEDAPFQLRVSETSDEELAESYLLRQNIARSGVYVDVNAFVCGYGSGNDTPPMAKYKIRSVDRTLRFKLIPVHGIK